MANEALSLIRANPTGKPFDIDVENLIADVVGKDAVNIANFENKLFSFGSETSNLYQWFTSITTTTLDKSMFMKYYFTARVTELAVISRNIDTFGELMSLKLYNAASRPSTVARLADDTVLYNQIKAFCASPEALQTFEDLSTTVWDDIFKNFRFTSDITDQATIVSKINANPKLYVSLMKSHFALYKKIGDPDKYSIEDIYNIIKSDLDPWAVEILTDKNSFDIEEAILLFDRHTAHLPISDNELISLYDSTHPDLVSIADKLKNNSYRSKFKGVNKAIIKTEIVGSGTPETKIFLGKDADLHTWFADNVMPTGVTEVRGDPLFDIFNLKAYGAGWGRKYDSELKYIYNFIMNNWDEGNNFRVTITSTLSICPSCKTYLWYLKKIAGRYGKEIEIRVISNKNVISIKDIKKRI